MLNLSEQSQSLVENYKKIHLNSLKKSNPQLAEYFKRINSNPNWFKGQKFNSNGELIHSLLIENLQKKLQNLTQNDLKVNILHQVIEALKKDDGSKKIDFTTLEILQDNSSDQLNDIRQDIKSQISQTPKLSDLLNEYAKMNDIFRRLRSVEYSQRDEIEHKGVIADDFGYTLKSMYEQGCSQEEVQEIINRVNFTPSLTSHPTNPQSVEYVAVAMNVVKVISNPNSTESEVSAAMDELTSTNLRVTPDKNKTQELEIDEALLYLDAIWDSVDEQYDILTKSIAESKFPELTLPDDFNKICVWVTGDGDGNPNSTPESLQLNIDKFKSAIKAKYIAQLNLLDLNQIAENLQNGEIYSPQGLIDAIKNEKGYNCEQEDKSAKSLIRKIRTFGFHYAKIDIRHTAVDLVKVKDAIDKVFNEVKSGNKDFSEQELRQYIVREVLKGELDLSDFGVSEKEIELTKRIAGRFKIAAKNPDMFEKIIAAEFDDPEQIQAVLQILKDTGNKIGETGSSLNIVPLAESRDNLQKLHLDIATALNNDKYFEHLKEVKKVYFMIARSDTVRRDGVGAQDAQEHAITDSVKTIAEILIQRVKSGKISEQELKQFKIIPYSGGGNALQRGGGKMTELASVYGRYCLNALNQLENEFVANKDEAGLEMLKILRHSIKEPCLTTQGHQNALIYQEGGKKLSRFISQAVYAGARTTQIIANKGVDLGYLRVIYDKEMAIYTQINLEDFSRKSYEEKISAIKGVQKNSNEDGKKIAEELIAAANFYYGQHSVEEIRGQDNPVQKNRLESQNGKIKEEFTKLIARKSGQASQSLTEISKYAVAEYKKHIGCEQSAQSGISSPVDKLLDAIGPWYFTKMGNVSSRANKRGQEEKEEKDKTFLELKGENPKVLAQRAIGVESVSTHSGTSAVAFLGWKNSIYKHFGVEGEKNISQIDQNKSNRIQELFCCSKSFRDLMRSAEMTIAQTDYEKAWSMLRENLSQNGCYRPSENQIKILHDSYVDKIDNNPELITQEEVLGFLDLQASQTKELIKLIAGGRSTCPEFSSEEKIFKKECQVATNLEAAVTKYGNEKPDAIITRQMRDIMKSTYAATDCDAKPGLLMEPLRLRHGQKSNIVDQLPIVTRVVNLSRDLQSVKQGRSSSQAEIEDNSQEKRLRLDGSPATGIFTRSASAATNDNQISRY